MFPENWSALRLFDALQTQWQVVATPVGGLRYLGLHYPSIPIVEARLGITADADLLGALQTLERAGRRVMNGG